ncbi:hypothetical protein QVD17_14821 [Tagetes erecta]|uniref:non-specific serine/threonine protein kinase n=1 Tax=Tagetes erecta TaxID=13708 RepID=A0AAD8NYZ5_TARER|nr:hypothetical protein QVD17_14821 [Tagetes erecta]
MQPSSRRHGLILDRPCGTPGYIDPAYATSSSVTHKSDVYSFGVVLIEVLSGRIASNYNYLYNKNGPVFLATLAKSSYENGTLHDMIHPVIRNQINPQALKIYAEAAYCCLKDQRAQRPHIDRVIVALDQALQLQLAFENSLVSKERPVEGAFITNQWKEKDLEHLKIEFDAIKLATENFAEKYLIGSGGYGVVYKAELEHFDSTAPKRNKKSEPPRRYSTVAIKRILDREDRQGEQGFIVEIDTLSSCMHPNVVSLLGFCHEPPHMILIYEHVSNGSLDDYLGSKGNMTNFSWVQRLKICIDIARGLDYIHATLDNKRKIIHRDIKSANILLGENWEAKIADFGLSKLHPLSRTQSTLNTKHVVGTRVYWDPEYERTGRLKKESDVYSFGVVLFELVTGRLAYDPVYTKENEKGLAPVVRQHFQKGTIREMIDPNLKEESMFTLGKGLNQDSLNRVLLIGHRCLAEKQAERPTMKVVIEELEKALSLQETQKDILQMSFEDIRLATQNFKNQIGEGGFGKIYRGEIIRYNERIPIAVKRHVKKQGQGEKEFLTELEILFEYKHENIIGLLGYCNENNEKIIVYKYASKGSLDKHLKDANLTWMKRLKIGIDAAVGLDFLHGADPPVIHRDIKSSNILLNENWKSKITDFGLSMIAPLNNEIDFMVDDACGTLGYVDPQFAEEGFLTKESDIYSFGVVLFEMLCGRTAFPIKGKRGYLGELVIRHYEEGNILELVFEGIKDQIVRKSLITFLEIAYECLHDEREMRPTANKVALQLKKALKFQEDVEIWAAKLPTDYKEIIKMSKNAEMLYNSNCLSIGNNGERNEMVSATMFSYENNILHNKRISIPNSRYTTTTRSILSSLGKVNRKKCYMLPAKTVLYESNPDVKCFEWNYLVEPETRFESLAN